MQHARENIAAFEASGAQAIVLNSAGCGAMCKEYGHLLAEDPKYRDYHAWMEQHGLITAPLARLKRALTGGGSAAASSPHAYPAE